MCDENAVLSECDESEKSELFLAYEMCDSSTEEDYASEEGENYGGRKLPGIATTKELYTKMLFYVENVLTETDLTYSILYDYVSHRIQYIRQQLALTMVEDEFAVFTLEMAVKFYAISYCRLCNEPARNFDPQANYDEILNCLECIMHMYKNKENSANLPKYKEDQFAAAYCLHNLGNSQAINYVLRGMKEMKYCDVTKQAVKLNFAFMNGNFLRFFKIVDRMSLFYLCFIFRHLESFRHRSFKVISKTYSSDFKLPVSTLRLWLRYSSSNDVRLLSRYYNYKVVEDFIRFYSTDFGNETELPPPPLSCVYAISLSHVCVRDFIRRSKKWDMVYNLRKAYRKYHRRKH